MSCLPAGRPCSALVALVLAEAQAPVQLMSTSCSSLRAACAVAGWCAEGWLLADPELLQEAAKALTTALRNYCKPLHDFCGWQ
jgi:hypothetical protein